MTKKEATPVPPVAPKATPVLLAAKKAQALAQAQVQMVDPHEDPRPPPPGRSYSTCSGDPSRHTVHSASSDRCPSSWRHFQAPRPALALSQPPASLPQPLPPSRLRPPTCPHRFASCQCSRAVFCLPPW